MQKHTVKIFCVVYAKLGIVFREFRMDIYISRIFCIAHHFHKEDCKFLLKKAWKAVGLYLINENLRRWQLIPSNPDWHWQVSGAIHVPPFLHPPLHFATKFQIVRNHGIILKLLFVIITFLAISSSVSRRTFTSVPKYSWTDSSV